ncbi:chromosome partition protein Smc [Brachionichthys hirsutus]|uniref:chromosome partition protein Smc n=1 Tax=Brachionichthys hirsutus TaxID=412623 RepID=UPI003605324B
MAAMIFQAVRQELDLQNSKIRMAENVEEVNRKEEAIEDAKKSVTELKTTLAGLNLKWDELKKGKEDAEKTTAAFDKGLRTCNTEKENARMKKTNIEEAISKLKADHSAAQAKDQETLAKLKEGIMERDRKICTFADLTKKEAKDLCGAIGVLN